jgi:serine/threonine protein kinase
VHHGHVEAVAMLITEKDEASRQRIVLLAMRPGDRVHAIDRLDREEASAHLVIHFAESRRVDVSELDGVALTQQSTLLASLPLSKALSDQALEARAQLVFAMEGAPVFARIAARIEPARWLDVDALRLLPVRSLGAPPPAIQAAIQARSARAVLGQAELSEEGIAAANALMGAAASSSPKPSPVLDAIVRALAVAIRLSQGLFGGGSAPSPKSTSNTKALPETRPREPSWLVRKLASWMDALRMRAWRSSLGDYLARKHAEYLARLMEQLDQGDVDAALRHAIPLSQTAGGPPKAPSLSLPSPRTDLSIQKTRVSGGSLGLEGSLYAMLKARYRALFDKLIAMGRIDDAAFVLAELLDDVLGAVALLEKRGRLREAAELAEARKLEPAIVVRQWILAKNIPRALLLARRHGAFEAAITHLGNEPEARKTLAIAWADMRAEAGDYLGALLALQMGQALDVATTPLALQWCELAQEAGGADGVVALVWRARLMGSIDTETERRVRRLLLDSQRETLPLRLAFISALAQRSEPFLAPLARLCLRTATRDRALYNQPPAATLEKLEVLGGGGVLREDRPTIEAARPIATRETRTLSMGPRGALAIRDAVLLPNGNWLVALGEAGTRILKPDGTTLVAMEAPASKLVVSDTGTRALALSVRGELIVVHRIDLVQRRIGDAFELARLDAHAASFDGERWAVVLDGHGHVLDVLAERPRSLFRLEHCTRVDRVLGCISFEVQGSTLERLRYDEHNIVLRVRQALPERFDRRINLKPFESAHEPIIAHLQTDERNLHLTVGAAPHPTPHSFMGWQLRMPLLSVGRTHVAFNAASSFEPQALGRYTLLSLHSKGLTANYRAKLTLDPVLKPSHFVESSVLYSGEGWVMDEELAKLGLLRGITHPNVVRVLEAGREGDTQFAAMEYVAGKDLAAIVRRLHSQKALLPLHLALGITMQLCEGLEALHNATSSNEVALQLVHRALSPRRCLIAFDGTAKVRIGKLFVPDEGVRMRGRIGYMSPEQVLGLPLDPRSDLFNLGTIFYELLTSKRLFHADTDFKTVEAIRDAIVPPFDATAEVPSEVQAILLKALARERSDRWQSAAEMRDALKALQVEAASSDALATWMRREFADDLRAEGSAHAPVEPGIVLVNSVQGDIEVRIVASARTAHRMLTPNVSTETLVCFDDEGRLLAVDATSGQPIASAFVH